MSLQKKKNLISVVSLIMLIFLCYGAYPRNAVAVSFVSSAPATVVIDAGHGGEDGGALSADGVKESGLNLQIALRADDLAALIGLRSVMTRQSDISLHDADCNSIAQKKVSDLHKRVDIVNHAENPVLLSFHQNHFPQEKYRGAQVFYAPDRESKSLADAIQLDLKQCLNRQNNRQAKTGKGIYLLDKSACPAILIECGFLSNPAELCDLQDENYQKKIVLSVLRTIAQKGNGVLKNEI